MAALKLITAKQVQDILEIDSVQLLRLVRDNKIRKVKKPFSRYGLYVEEDVLVLLAEKQKFESEYTVDP